MTAVWSPTAGACFTRVSKARIPEAVTEAHDAAEAERIAAFHKTDMAEAAERLVEGTDSLPPLLRTAPATDEAEGGAAEDGGPAERGDAAEPDSAEATEDGSPRRWYAAA